MDINSQSPKVMNNKQANIVNKEEITSATIIDLYLSLKQKLKDHVQAKLDPSEQDQQTVNVEADEKQKLSQLGIVVILDYIRSSIDILLNLKIEDALEEQKNKNKLPRQYINSSRGGNGDMNDAIIESFRSSSQSSVSQEPPKVYEELIQNLEADVRKHIRIEQQLKLHIENIEYRNDELENENEKLLKKCSQFNELKQEIEDKQKQQLSKAESELQKLKQEFSSQESKYKQDIQLLRESYIQQIEQLSHEIQRLNQELIQTKISSPITPLNLFDQQQYVKHQQMTNLGKQSKDLDQILQSSKKNKPDFNQDSQDQKSAKSGNKKLFFKRSNILYCTCTCHSCLVTHQIDNSQHSENMPLSGHYKKMQKQFLERPLIQQLDNLKHLGGGNGSAKRSSASKKRNNINSSVNYNFNFSSLATSTPDKQTQNLQELINVLNISTQSAHSKNNTSNNIIFPTGNTCCQLQKTTIKKTNNSASQWTYLGEDNPYLQNQIGQKSSQFSKNSDVLNSAFKTQGILDSSSNNSMLISSEKTKVSKRVQNHSLCKVKQFNPNTQSIEQETSFENNKDNSRKNGQGLVGVLDFNINTEMDEDSSESVLNSHRRSRSQNVCNSNTRNQHSKSERKSNRLQIMQYRQLNNGSGAIQKDILKLGTFSTNKATSFYNETTPNKKIANQTKNLSMNNQNVLSSEERQKLFNTFMREMNNSSLIQNSAPKKKKKSGKNEGIISDQSARPRSQLSMVQNNVQVQNNYSMLAPNNSAGMKYKFVNTSQIPNNQSINQSRNNAMHKIKDFFMHNTHNACSLNSSNPIGCGTNNPQTLVQLTNNQRQSMKKQHYESYQFSPIKKK